MNLKQLITALRCNTYRGRSAPGALLFAAALLLPDCGKVADNRFDSESHFVSCSSDADCGATGGTCAAGMCVDADPAPVAEPSPVGDAQRPPVPDAANCTVPIPEARITQVGQLDRFEGCENIYGDVRIDINADLRPLRALRYLHGSLTISPLKEPQASLEGLDNLELVSGSLRLMRLGEASLAHLAQLRSIGTAPEDELLLLNSELRDLSGLEHLAGLQHLEFYGLTELVSIDALRLPASMSSITFSGVPALASAEALRSVATIDSLTLRATGFAQLDMLSGTHVHQLLVDSDVTAAGTGSVGAVDELTIQVNDPRSGPLELPPQIAGLKKLAISNGTLTSVSGLAQVTHLDTLSVDSNLQLSTLSLPGLQSVSDVEVFWNDGLTALDLPQLKEPVQNLVVVANASLRSDTLAPVSASARRAKVGANQGDPIGLAPCPFEQDGDCDAVEQATDLPRSAFQLLCAPGTDLVDCANGP